MLIGVLSDTHDQADNIKKAITILNEEKVDLVIHCGDWVSPFIVGFFSGLVCPIKGIFGNNDGDRFRHLFFKDRWGLDLELEERFLELNVDNKKIAVFHGDYPQLVNALVQCGSFDAVFHGHTHKRVLEKVGKTLSLNPGSFMPETSPSVQGASFALYDTKTNDARHIML